MCLVSELFYRLPIVNADIAFAEICQQCKERFPNSADTSMQKPQSGRVANILCIRNKKRQYSWKDLKQNDWLQ